MEKKRTVGGGLGLGALILLLFASCSSQEISIGFLATLSGAGSQMGNSGGKALAMAAAEVNARGGIRGRLVRIETLDDKGDPQKALEAAKVLESRRVQLVIGPLTSGVMDDLWPFMNSHQMLFISPTVCSALFSGHDDFFYRMTPLNSRMGDFLARAMADRNLHRIAVLTDSANKNFTGNLMNHFSQTVGFLGGSLVKMVSFNRHMGPQTRALAQELSQDHPDGFLILADGFDTASMGQALANLDQMQPIYTSPWSATRELIELGGNQISRITLAGWADPDCRSPAYLDFEGKYRDLYHDWPDAAAVNTWDAFQVLAQALQDGSGVSSLDVKQVLDRQRTFSGLQSPVTFNPGGEVERPLYLIQVKDNRFTRVQP